MIPYQCKNYECHISPSERAAILSTVTTEFEKRYPEIDTNVLSNLINCAIVNYGRYPQTDREIEICHFSGLWEWQRRMAAEQGYTPFPPSRWTDMWGNPA
jgi:hypothetical protein